jgi:hypothetical protein
MGDHPGKAKNERHGWRNAVAVSLVVVTPVVLTAASFWLAAGFEFEFPYWPTVWLASQTKPAHDGRMAEVTRARYGQGYKSQHWHHCSWCDVVYPHAPHMAIKVTMNEDEDDFFLFDWDLWHRRLVPITVRTAKLFPG